MDLEEKVRDQTVEEAGKEQHGHSHHIHLHTLGHLRLRHEHTNEIILTPAPSDDPNDPLRWSTAYKIYIAILVSLAMVMCNFMAAGPTIAMVSIASDYKHGGDTMSQWIASAAYFFNNSALLQGVSTLFWVPLLNKYGRRPIYLVSMVLYLFMILGAGFAKTYAGELTTRTILGIGAGAGECLAPVTITDVFYLHQRGYGMAIYNAALSAGVAFGIIIAGLVTISHPWRTIYWVGCGLVGGLLLVIFFFFPETAFVRNPNNINAANANGTTTTTTSSSVGSEHIPPVDVAARRESYGHSLRPWTGRTYTSESFWRMFIRPFGLILLPPVFWATIVMSVTIGFLVAVVSNVASAFSTTYGFEPWQCGLCFISAIIGCVLGTFAGGPFTDWAADYFTQRNGGIREPEMRLPAIIPSVIAAPLALALYGCGIEYKWHWMVPTFGLGLLSFAISQGTNVSFVYCIDAYRPVAAEVTVAQLAFKSCFGFLLSFYTNPWVEKSGYARAYGAMAGISGGCLLFFIPLYFWGKRIRIASMKWSFVRFVFWKNDREVGE